MPKKISNSLARRGVLKECRVRITITQEIDFLDSNKWKDGLLYTLQFYLSCSRDKLVVFLSYLASLKILIPFLPVEQGFLLGN